MPRLLHPSCSTRHAAAAACKVAGKHQAVAVGSGRPGSGRPAACPIGAEPPLPSGVAPGVVGSCLHPHDVMPSAPPVLFKIANHRPPTTDPGTHPAGRRPRLHAGRAPATQRPAPTREGGDGQGAQPAATTHLHPDLAHPLSACVYAATSNPRPGAHALLAHVGLGRPVGTHRVEEEQAVGGAALAAQPVVGQDRELARGRAVLAALRLDAWWWWWCTDGRGCARAKRDGAGLGVGVNLSGM